MLTIGEVAQEIGLTPLILRAWERRYGFPKPARGPGGHRLYAPETLELLWRVRSLIKAGYPAGRAVERVLAERAASDSGLPGIWERWREELVAAVDTFDAPPLHFVYEEAMVRFRVDLVIDQLLLPVLRRLGEEWDDTPGGIAREHFLSGFLRNELSVRFHHELLRADGPTLVCACLPGELHEIGLMLFCLQASGAGFRVRYFGQSLPVAQAAHVARAVDATAIVLSGTCMRIDEELLAEIGALAQPGGPVVMVGGDASIAARPGLEEAGVIAAGNGIAKGLELLNHALRTRADGRMEAAQRSESVMRYEQGTARMKDSICE